MVIATDRTMMVVIRINHNFGTVSDTYWIAILATVFDNNLCFCLESRIKHTVLGTLKIFSTQLSYLDRTIKVRQPVMGMGLPD